MNDLILSWFYKFYFKKFMKIIDFLFDIISPKKCYSCWKIEDFLCEDCLLKIRDFEEKCYVCKKYSKNYENHKHCIENNNIFYNKILVLKHYKNFYIKRLVKQWKFYNKPKILEFFCEDLYKKFLENEKVKNLENYLVISVPSYFLRRLKRWYNSSEVLAKRFSKISKIKYKNILKKVKQTKQQSKLSRQERLINLKDSFVFNKKFLDFVNWKNIIILDDVISTWSTINEISRILKQNWAEKIIWIMIASD